MPRFLHLHLRPTTSSGILSGEKMTRLGGHNMNISAKGIKMTKIPNATISVSL